MSTSIRDQRKQAGRSQVEMSASARCSINTWRLFELAPEGLSPEKRAACEAAMAQLRKTSAPPPSAPERSTDPTAA
jgi:hypothetical protein